MQTQLMLCLTYSPVDGKRPATAKMERRDGAVILFQTWHKSPMVPGQVYAIEWDLEPKPGEYQGREYANKPVIHSIYKAEGTMSNPVECGERDHVADAGKKVAHKPAETHNANTDIPF